MRLWGGSWWRLILGEWGGRERGVVCDVCGSDYEIDARSGGFLDSDDAVRTGSHIILRAEKNRFQPMIFRSKFGS